MVNWKHIVPLAAALLAAGHAPAAPAVDDTAAVEYETYFEPFDDNPVMRLRTPVPLPPPTPLFAPYDPIKGLEAHTATSRAVAPTRAVFSLAVLTAKVGDEVRVPLYQISGPPVTASVVWVVFDPTILQAVDARAEAWKGSSVDINATPDNVTPERRFIVVQASPDAHTTKGPLMSIRFKVLAEGDSTIEVERFDAADDTYNTIPAVVRNGLVRARK